MHGREDKCLVSFRRKNEGNRPHEDLVVDGRIIFKYFSIKAGRIIFKHFSIKAGHATVD